MSGPLDNLSSIAEANAEADVQQKLRSPGLWRRLELYRLASISSTSREEADGGRAKEKKLALSLLKDVEPRLLFLAVDVAFGQLGDESKRKAVESALLGVCGSSVGPELLDQNNSELVPFFLAGLCHPATGVKKLSAKALVVLGLGNGNGNGGGGGGGEQPAPESEEEERDRIDRCRALVQPPLLPALVAALGDVDTGVAQAAADALVTLCEKGDGGGGGGGGRAETNATASTACRRAAMGALSSQIGEVVAGMTARQSSTPRLRFADTAARLMSASDAAFNAAVDAGALSLVTDLTEDASDVLLQLNALELLEQVASTAGGARHLLSNGHLDRLLVAAGGGGEGAVGGADPDPLLGTSALRTLAKVLAKAEGVGLEVWRERSPAFLEGFLRACAVHIEGREEAGKLAGLVAVSTVAEASSEALKAMLSQQHGAEGGVLDAWLTLSAHKVEVKAAALHAVALVLGAPTYKTSSNTAAGGSGHNDGDGDEVMGNTAAAAAAAATGVGAEEERKKQERSSLCRMLLQRLAVCNNRPTGGALLFELARQPVPEVRHAAYDVLRCMVWQPGGWALAEVFAQPGFRAFLEERDTGASKATKEWKFSVVESIMGCKDRTVLGQEVLESFRTILKQGPFFVPTTSRQVATAE
ncbi:unnamed protein product [Scytosiphon promiscuus]